MNQTFDEEFDTDMNYEKNGNEMYDVLNLYINLSMYFDLLTPGQKVLITQYIEREYFDQADTVLGDFLNQLF